MGNDKIILRFSRNNVFEFTEGLMQIECELLHEPDDVGDWFRFKYGDIEFKMNPLSDALVGYYVIDEPE